MSQTVTKVSAEGLPGWVARLVLAMAGVFAAATSYLAWTRNTHELVLRHRFPTWYRDGYVLFDGYGDFTDVLYEYLKSPGPEQSTLLSQFLTGYLHSNTPVYPGLSALARLAGLSTVWACVLVSLLSSIVCVLLFVQLVKQMSGRSRLDGPGLLCAAGFVLHVPVLSGFVRPLPDMTALAIQLLFFLSYGWFRERPRAWPLLVCVAAVVVGTLTKTYMLLLIPTLGLLLLRDFVTRPDVRRSRGVLAVAGVFAAAGAAKVAMIVAAGETAVSIGYIQAAAMNAFEMLRDPPPTEALVRAGGLFFVLALGAYPLLMLAGGRDLRRSDWALEHALWIAIYVAQRFLFLGFSTQYGRARYGIPLAASVLLLSLPGMRRLWERPAGRLVAALPLACGLVIWLWFLLGLG
ncbi:MAG: hypothetical protein N2111_08540 [Candidatus Sumerlaeaceae bacterium]|nr:hypothetical protein [Candidatus Sumerlaeaceae bacterium]